MVDASAEYACMTAGILAGGKSSRMGKNKAFLIWKERPLLEYLAKILLSEPSFYELLISVGEAAEYQELKQRWQGRLQMVLVEDVRQDYGPLEGLYRLLIHGKYPWMFVTATDMPLICPEFIQGMLGQPREGVQAVIPRTNGRIHPLCGLYAKSALPALEQLLCRGEHKVKHLLETLAVRYVDVEMLGIDVSVLENVNTPEEYRRIERRKLL